MDNKTLPWSHPKSAYYYPTLLKLRDSEFASDKLEYVIRRMEQGHSPISGDVIAIATQLKVIAEEKERLHKLLK